MDVMEGNDYLLLFKIHQLITFSLPQRSLYPYAFPHNNKKTPLRITRVLIRQ